MSKKSLFLTIVFVSGFLLMGYFNTTGSASPVYINDETNNSVRVRYDPKPSATQVTSLWNFTGMTTIDQVEISKNGNYIAAINSSSVFLFHESSNTTLWYYSPGGITSCDISYDGELIAAASQGGSMAYLLNNAEESPKTSVWSYFLGTAVSQFYIAISENGDSIALSADNWLFLFNDSYSSGNKQEVWNCTTLGSPINSLAVSIFGNYIVVGCDDGFVYFFNTTKTTPKTYEWRFNTTAQVTLVDIGWEIVKDFHYIVAANQDQEIYLLNSTFENPKTAVWNATLNNIVTTIDISLDGTTIVASDTRYIYYFNNSYSPTTKKEMWNRDLGTNKPSVAVNGDGTYVAAGTVSGTLYLINDKNETLWSTPQPILSAGISVLGGYMVGRGVFPDDNKIYLYSQYIPKRPVTVDSGDDDDDDEEEAAIPFGNYYLIFACIALISLIVIMKRKVIFNA